MEEETSKITIRQDLFDLITNVPAHPARGRNTQSMRALFTLRGAGKRSFEEMQASGAGIGRKADAHMDDMGAQVNLRKKRAKH